MNKTSVNTFVHLITALIVDIYLKETKKELKAIKLKPKRKKGENLKRITQ